MEPLEVGVVTAHPIVYGFKLFKSVMKTWAQARKLNVDCNKWYGVYETGTEIIVAVTGCLPGAERNAKLIVLKLSDWKKAQGRRNA